MGERIREWGGALPIGPGGPVGRPRGQLGHGPAGRGFLLFSVFVFSFFCFTHLATFMYLV